MPKGLRRPALVMAIATAAVVAVAGCAPRSYSSEPISRPQPMLGHDSAEALIRLGSDLGQMTPDTQVLPASPASRTCGPADTLVIRGVFPERLLFATASDELAPEADAVLTLLADRIRRDAPGSELTVLGHTDAVGSDTYNLDLSQRRARRVMRALMALGLASDQLSAVAIGKRQPIASNATPEGRTSNRRAEFLISGCLAANLEVIRAQTPASVDAAMPVDVMRLNPAAANGLATVGQISLRQPGGEAPVPATVALPASARPPMQQRPASVARPAPAPHYLPKTLSPDAQRNPLGPAVPF